MALARHVDPDLTSWAAAARFLGLPSTYTRSGHRLHAGIRQAGQTRAFAAALDEVAQRLEDVDTHPDLAQRRDALADMTVMPDMVWQRILDRSVVHPQTQSWRWPQQAYAWMWVTATSGDFYLAPALGFPSLSAAAVRAESQAYRAYFVPRQIPRLRQALIAEIRTLVRSRELPGPAVPGTPQGMIT